MTQRTDLPNKMAAVIARGVLIRKELKSHASTHNAKRQAKRQALETQHSLMKGIPPGGIQ